MSILLYVSRAKVAAAECSQGLDDPSRNLSFSFARLDVWTAVILAGRRPLRLPISPKGRWILHIPAPSPALLSHSPRPPASFALPPEYPHLTPPLLFRHLNCGLSKIGQLARALHFRFISPLCKWRREKEDSAKALLPFRRCFPLYGITTRQQQG